MIPLHDGFAALAGGFLLWRRRREPGERSALAVFAFFASFCTLVYVGVVMTCYWANATDPLTARFTLPLWICLSLLAALLGRLRYSLPLVPLFLLLGGTASLVNGARAPERFPVGHAWRGCDEWSLPPDVLIVSPSNNRLVLRRQPSVMFSKMKNPESVLNLLDSNIYREVWILDFRKGKPLPPGWILNPLEPEAYGIPSASFSLRRIDGFTFPDGRTRLAQPGSLSRPPGVSGPSWALRRIREL